jgi:ribosomal protein S18 acetylase RimI-like enzyme
MSTTASIRSGTDSDLKRLGSLGALLVKTHHHFDNRRFLAANSQTPAAYSAFLGTHLADPTVVILVAEDHGEVVGYAFATVEGANYLLLRGPAGVLQDIIVHPKHRGRGAGQLLLDAMLAHLKSRGVSQVVLSTAEANEAAQRLFARMGFRRTMIEMTREVDDAIGAKGTEACL